MRNFSSALVINALCIGLFGCEDGSDDDQRVVAIADGGSLGSLASDSGDSSQANNGDSGVSALDEAPFYCGETRCDQLEDETGLGKVPELRWAFEYCCTSNNECNTRQIGETECPDLVVCGGEVCSNALGTVATGGATCCSSSEKCSVTLQTANGITCPEPVETDIDCPDVDYWLQYLPKAPGSEPFSIDLTVVGGEPCCSPDRTCGLVIVNICFGSAAFPLTEEAPTIDCSGEVVDAE